MNNRHQIQNMKTQTKTKTKTKDNIKINMDGWNENLKKITLSLQLIKKSRVVDIHLNSIGFFLML
jgi:hypothetical protein